MNIEFDESEMRFGPFAEENCFRIERSALYRRIQSRLKISEFVLLRTSDTDGCEVWVIEAKSSVPQGEERLLKYMAAVREKLTNALLVTIAARLERHREATQELPVGFQGIDLKVADFKCVLVIKGAPKQHLGPLKDFLAREMSALVKTLGLKPNSVTVINDDQARSYNLIV